MVGYDPREELAWQVCRHSIESRTTVGGEDGICVTPLILEYVRDLLTRPFEMKDR